MIMVSLNAGCSDESQAAHVVEVFGRVMAGLALEGTMISMSLQSIEVDENTPSVGSDDLDGPS